MNNGIHEGQAFTWTNGTAAAVSAGDVVVVGDVLAVAAVDIAVGASGAVVTRYAFTVPKVSAAVIAQGESLTWDVSAGAFDDNAAVAAVGDVTGAAAFAMADGADGDTTLEVVLTGVPGTVN